MNTLPRDAKILLVTEPSGGGSGRHVVDLARELSHRGLRVHVAYSPTRAEKRFEEELRSSDLAKVFALPMQRQVGPWDFADALRLRRLIAEEGPYDVVHAHSSKAGALARAVTSPRSLRIYTPHAFRTMDPAIGRKGSLVYGSIETLLARVLTDGVIAVSREEYDHALALGIPKSKLFLVLNGVAGWPPIDRAAVRRDLEIPPDAIVVGFVGRMSDQKNPLRFVEALRIAHARDPRIVGVMIGDGELFPEVTRTAPPHVRLLGSRDARRYLEAFDLFAMTSNYEAMPYVLIEALFAGLPIVATRVGGTAATVRAGENGALVPIDASPRDFADALLPFVDADRLAAQSAASRRLAEGFTTAKMAQETVAVYDACLRRKIGGA